MTTPRIWPWENFSAEQLRGLGDVEVGAFLRAINHLDRTDLSKTEEQLLRLICESHKNWIRSR
jgi:hypothetical protein